MDLMQTPGKLGWVQRLLLHILFWIAIVTYFAWGFGFNVDYKTSFLNALLYLPGHMIMVYSLVYFLIPRFLITKKYVYFFAGFAATLILCMIYASFAQLSINDAFKGFNMTTGRNILPFVHVAGIAISINLLKYWWLQQRKTLEAVQQKTAAELELLKSQVHPHFLFNTLNNLYSRVLEKSDEAPAIVLKLSGLLRFMIYESAVPSIPLRTEINLLKEYISLEQLRYGNRLDISLAVDGNMENKEIAPLLMLPLIENAFKHGASKQLDQCWISLNIHLTERAMYVKLLNSFEAEKPGSVDTTLGAGKGIGLENVKRRLQLIYPGRYRFSALASGDVYVVNLDLHWTENHLSVIKDNNVKIAHELEMSVGG
jgi:hypothetical protein